MDHKKAEDRHQLLAMEVWSVFDRNKTAYPITLHWLRVWLRYYLATMMVFYGVSKVLHLQMPPPTLYELVQPLGEKSPMALAWSYVGLSDTFSMFTGLAEILGGVLLFFRRTTTIGALIVATILLNVLVGFFWDRPRAIIHYIRR